MPHPPRKTDNEDRDVPAEYVGKLDPGYYCRAWNPRRQKYCKARAGFRTDHPLVGRCWLHDGGASKQLKHGQNRRYELTTIRVRELMEQHADAPDPLDMLPELALGRALLQDFIDRRADDPDDADADGLAEGIRLVEKVAGIVEKIESIKAKHAIGIKELDLLMLNMGRVVRQHVPDDAVCQRILDGWLALRV